MKYYNINSNKYNNSKIIRQIIPKSKSLNKYNNYILHTENNNIRNHNYLIKDGLYSINKNYIQIYYNNIFNGFFKSKKKKIDSLNNSIFSKGEIKKLFENENYEDNSQIIKIMNNNTNEFYDKPIINKIDLSLPKIRNRNSLSLKNILNYKNKKNLDGDLLKKEINKSDINLINYLKLDKLITPSFVKKVNIADEEKLFKLDKICQKYFEDEKKGIILKNNIQKKIKKEFSKDAEFYKNGLKNMNNALKGIKHIYKGFQSKVEDIRNNKKKNVKEIFNQNINKK